MDLPAGYEKDILGQAYGLYVMAVWATEPRLYPEGPRYPWAVYLLHPHPVALFDLPYGAVPVATGRAEAPGQAQLEAHHAAQDLLRRLAPDEEHLDRVADQITRAWDRWGAPSVARAPSGNYVASFEGPGGAFSVEAPTKREAYRQARREWLKRILARD
jgi:hypothetical protein